MRGKVRAVPQGRDIQPAGGGAGADGEGPADGGDLVGRDHGGVHRHSGGDVGVVGDEDQGEEEEGEGCAADARVQGSASCH